MQSYSTNDFHIQRDSCTGSTFHITEIAFPFNVCYIRSNFRYTTLMLGVETCISWTDIPWCTDRPKNILHMRMINYDIVCVKTKSEIKSKTKTQQNIYWITNTLASITDNFILVPKCVTHVCNNQTNSNLFFTVEHIHPFTLLTFS